MATVQLEVDFWDHLQAHVARSESLLASLYSLSHTGGLSKSRTPYTRNFAATYKELVARLVRKFPEHPGLVELGKADALGAATVRRASPTIEAELRPLWLLLQDVLSLRAEAADTLMHINALLAPLSPDYLPQMLHSYMACFCNLVRLEMMLARVPGPLLVQLYTLAYAYCQQPPPPSEGSPLSTGPPSVLAFPPDHRALATHIVSNREGAVPMLQQALQPLGSRVGQVLESVAFPTIALACSLPALRASGILSLRTPPPGAEAGEGGPPGGLPRARMLQNLQWLEDLKTWALFGLLVFPVEACRAGAMGALRLLLEEGCLLHVWRRHCEPLHALFLAHVRPGLIRNYKAARHTMEREHRRLQSQQAKEMVDDCHRAALTSSPAARAARRVWLTQQLHRAVLQLETQPSALPQALQVLLAGLSFARCELLAFFRQMWQEVPLPRKKAPGGQPFARLQADVSVPALIQAMQRSVQLVTKYRTAICGYHVAAISGTCTLRVIPVILHAATTPAITSDARARVLTDEMLDIAQTMGSLPLPTDPSATAGTTSEAAFAAAAVNLDAMRTRWFRLSALLFSSVSPLSAAVLEAAADGRGLLFHLTCIVSWSYFVDALQGKLDRVSSLCELALWRDKLRAVYGTCLQRLVDHAPYIPSLLFPLASFHAQRWLEGEVARDEEDGGEAADAQRGGGGTAGSCTALAEALASELMRRTIDAAAQLLVALHVAYNPADALDLPQLSARMQEQAALQLRMDRTRSTPRGMRMPQHLWAPLLHLFSSLASSEPWAVSSALVMVPSAWTSAVVRLALQRVLTLNAINGKDIHRPSQLESALSRFQVIAYQLQQVTGQDLRATVTHVLLAQGAAAAGASRGWAAAEGTAAGPAPPVPGSGSRVLGYISDWYLHTVVLDGRKWGMEACPERMLFCSDDLAGGDVSLYASVPQLRALLRCFGLPAAVVLAQRGEQVLRDSCAAISGFMSAHLEMVQEMGAEYEACGGVVECASRYCFGLLPALPQLVDAARCAGRALLLRAMASAAAEAELGYSLPHVAQLLCSCSVYRRDGSAPAVSRFAGLPAPAGRSRGPGAMEPDPALVSALKDAGMVAQQLWRRWPLALALVYWSPAWGAPEFRPATGQLLGNMGGVALTVAHLAAALPAAVLPDGGEAAGGAEPTAAGGGGEAARSPAESMRVASLRCFVSCVSSVLATQGCEGVGGKLLSVDELVASGVLPRSVLEAAGLPYTRVQSAFLEAQQLGAGGATGLAPP